ncbi:NAD(P)-dependent oxidoreductase [Tistlia consotensis]|uniref:NAD(P)-dependent oxidoreductase n=1 Tax=Tistlia consotensis TaxID=1321365 RepID=UPI002285DD02|nr:NAD(P)-dependent oxidoreductase [Tistlia consotensis]
MASLGRSASTGYGKEKIMQSVAILGLGAMGSRMAMNLVKAGYRVAVWNRSPEKARPLAEAGASVAATPRQAAQGAEVVLSMVRDDPAARETWLDAETGALGGMAPGALALESSTVTVAWAQELAAACAEREVGFLETPVAGSRPQAEAGQLVFLVGGDARLVERATPLMQVMGRAIHHAGPVGSAAALKLSVNALLGLQIAAMGELVGLLGRYGIDAARAAEILPELPVCSPAAAVALRQMRDRAFDPLFPAVMIEKDLGYLHEIAAAAGAEVPLGDAARRVFARAVEAGYGDDQMSGVLRLYL